jgi:hypothetical protein
MAVTPETVLTVISTSAGVITGAGALLTRRVTDRAEKQAVERLERAEAKEGTVAPDLASMGHFLYSVVGAMPLGKYATDEHATLLVTQAVEQIQRFLNDDAAVGPLTVTGEMEAAERALADGRVWDGLASLRRSVEARLREIAATHGLEPGRKGAGRLLADLDRREQIPKDVAQGLRYVIDVANRGVHGEPVDPSQADEALFVAKSAFSTLEADSRG